MRRQPGQCETCAHLRQPFDGPASCGAYPFGMPEPIYTGEVDHRRPLPDQADMSVVWTPAEGVTSYPSWLPITLEPQPPQGPAT